MQTGGIYCDKLAQKVGEAMQEYKSVQLHWTGKHRIDEGQQASIDEIERVLVNPHAGVQAYYEPTEIRLPSESIENIYCFGDNLLFLQDWSRTNAVPKIDLIYIDPPYMTELAYNSTIAIGSPENQTTILRSAFHDRWIQGLSSYLDMLYPRLAAMRDALSEEGSIFVHVDWHAGHYVRVLMDEIFGMENFINDIAWCFGGGGNSRRHFHRKHDSILWYARSPQYIFNPQFRPYTPGTVERGLTSVKGDRYRLHQEGALMQDWWTDINKILSPTAYENLKYPTQKPKELLQRLVAAATRPGSLVADFFSGSGTMAEVCNQTGRSWILCDNSPLALQTTMYRLIRSGSDPFRIMAPCGPENTATGELILKTPQLSSIDDKHRLLDIGIHFYRNVHMDETPARKDFSDYIEFWELDLDYRDTFNSCCQVIREKHRYRGPLALDLLVRIETGRSRRVAIKVWDVWANQTTAIVEIDA